MRSVPLGQLYCSDACRKLVDRYLARGGSIEAPRAGYPGGICRLRGVDSWPCPKCGNGIPATGMSGKQGQGDAEGNVSWQPPVSHTTCSSCGAELERSPEAEGELEHLQA